MVLVRGGVDGLQNSLEFRPGLGYEHFLLVGESAVPVGYGVGGFDNYWEIKGQLHGLVVLVGAGGGLGEGEAVLGAHLVEVFLDGKSHQKFFIDALEGVPPPFTKLVLIAHQQLDVVVPTGNQKQLLAAALISLGKVQQGFDEHRVVLQVRLHHLYGDDLASETGA